jgi:hypothetical protein
MLSDSRFIRLRRIYLFLLSAATETENKEIPEYGYEYNLYPGDPQRQCWRFAPKIRETVSSKLFRFAEVFVARRDSSAAFTKEFAVFHQRLVLVRIAELVAQIDQVTQVFIVSRVR